MTTFAVRDLVRELEQFLREHPEDETREDAADG